MSARDNGGYRCPCHNRQFRTKPELKHHMSPVALPSLGVDNYQTWLENLDIHASVPKLAPVQPKTSRVMRPTESHLQRMNGTVSSRGTSPESRKGKRPKAKRTVKAAGSVWAEAIAKNEIVWDYLQVLLALGSHQPLDELAPSSLDQQTHEPLMILFTCLDRDKDGKIDADDLNVASHEVTGTPYQRKNFQRLDKPRNGFIDLIGMFKALFPLVSTKRLQAKHERFSKPVVRIVATRDLLSVADRKEIDGIYERLSSKPGGCTFQNMMSLFSPYLREREKEIFPLYQEFDDDGNGELTLEEFTEMLKSNYAPFRKVQYQFTPRDRSEQLIDLTKYTHPIMKDDRIFAPTMPSLKRKPYGTNELQYVHNARLLEEKRLEFEEKSAQLHVTKDVMKFSKNYTKVKDPL